MNYKTVKTFWFSFLLESASQIISLFLPVYFSAQVGIIVRHLSNKSSIDGIIVQTIFTILILALVAPLAAFLSAKYFLKKSIEHDGENLQSILNKDISQVRNFGSEKILQFFENDLIEYRINLRAAIVTPITAAVLAAALIMQTSNMLFLLIIFVVSAIPILFNSFYSKYESEYYDNSAAYDEERMAFEENVADNKVPLILFSLKDSILHLHHKKYSAYLQEHGKKDIAHLSFAKAILQVCTYVIQVVIIASFSFLLHSATIENLAASLFLIYPIGEITSQLIDWIQALPLIKILKQRVSRFAAFEDSLIPQAGYEELKTVSLSYRLPNREFFFPNLSVKKGDKILIEGDNGSGKTILLKMLTGELRPSSGEIIFSKELSESFGYVPQSSLAFNTTAEENIMLGKNETARMQEMIKKFSLEKLFENERTESVEYIFSGGETKKMDIARCLLHSRGMLILDEPTNNLDEKSVEELIRFLQDKTVIFTSHDSRLKLLATQTIKITA